MILHPLEIFNCTQNSPEWHECRRGVITASKFSTVMAKGEGKTRKKYLYTLAGEILTGQVQEGYTSDAMKRGHAMEDDARREYAWNTGVDPEIVGFMRRGHMGGSPDSLIGEDGGLEIKTLQPDLMIALLEADRAPPEHKAQIQGLMLITGRSWWDFVGHWNGLPQLVKRCYRDEPYIEQMQSEIDAFHQELTELVTKIRGMMA